MSETPEREPEVVDAELVEPQQATPTPVGDYTEGGVPTFDYVRDRIEGRVATTAGATELPEESARSATLDEQMAERDRVAREKLEQIRRSMRNE